jgi:coenzyme F420 hydrogenase subunit beta
VGAKSFQTVRGVVDSQLCLGCGACAYICPDRKIELVDVPSHGVRPVVADENCDGCRACLKVCPAYENDHRSLLDLPELIPEIKSAYGPVLEIWEGHASDPEIRFMGSSGGVITALSLFCLEREGMHGVLHVAADPENPIRNCTRLSRTREELLAATGSRYSPASACDRLGQFEKESGPCVFIGQPSEATAFRKAEQLRPALARNAGLVLSFFCAGSPSTEGTEELIRAEGIELDEVEEVRYRGLGWPGWFGVRRRGSPEFKPLQTYAYSWEFLQRFRPLSVNLTPDGSGEDADISCGDPWYRPIGADEAGHSLVLVRTERGRGILRRACKAGYLTLTPADAFKALNSQPNLIRKRGAIWGRLVALRLFGLPAPRLRGFSLFENWKSLSPLEQAQSILGTMRRIVQRRLYRPLEIPKREVVRRRRQSTPWIGSDRR